MENTTPAASPITGHTGLICLLGSPCAHSVSPMMHNASFEALGLDYRYLAFDVNEETLPTAVAGLKVLGARGFNLTMPDKNLMVSLCDELSTAARIIGAVNTVVNEDGRLIGHNTDGIGYMQSVKDAGYDIIGKKMTLLGAGGAATAILVQAALDGLKEISVFVRPTSRFYDRLVHTVDELTEITDCRIRICDFSDADLLKKELADSAILTNGTSVGMAPHEDNLPGPGKSDFSERPHRLRYHLQSCVRQSSSPWLKIRATRSSTDPICSSTRVPRPSVSGPEWRCQWRRSRRNFSLILFIQKAT